MKASELIQELIELINRDGDCEVEITPRFEKWVHQSRPIENICGDGEGGRNNGAIYIQCEIYEGEAE